MEPLCIEVSEKEADPLTVQCPVCRRRKSCIVQSSHWKVKLRKPHAARVAKAFMRALDLALRRA